MTTQVFNVPVGAPVLFRPGPYPFSFTGLPGPLGTLLLDYSLDGGVTFIQHPLGSILTPYSLTNGTLQPGAVGIPPTAGQYQVPMGAIVRATAGTAQGQLICADLTQPVGGAGAERPTLLVSGAQYASNLVLTTEQAAFSMRFPPGLLKQNFLLKADFPFTCQNTANAKTIKLYFGPAVNSAIECAQTALQSQLLTSMAGGVLHFACSGRNDYQTIQGQNIGVTGAGYGTSVTANQVNTTQNYAGPTAVEYALVVTYTKATAAETLSLDGAHVQLFQ